MTHSGFIDGETEAQKGEGIWHDKGEAHGIPHGPEGRKGELWELSAFGLLEKKTSEGKTGRRERTAAVRKPLQGHGTPSHKTPREGGRAENTGARDPRELASHWASKGLATTLFIPTQPQAMYSFLELMRSKIGPPPSTQSSISH